jgi:hypothetical protein
LNIQKFHNQIIFLFFLGIIASLSQSNVTLSSYAHINDPDVQELIDKNKNIKIQFVYLPDKPIIDTFTELQFSVQDLETEQHLKDFDARVVVTNGQRLFKFENITVPDGDFSVKYIFPDDGTHQVLLRVNTNNSILLTSFSVFVPHQSPPSLLNPFPQIRDEQNDIGRWISIIIIIVIPVVVLISIIAIIKKKI